MLTKRFLILAAAIVALGSSARADDAFLYATIYNAYGEGPEGRGLVKISASGVLSVWDVKDSGGTSIAFEDAEGLALDSTGNVFVNDGQYVYKITPAGVGSIFATKPNPYSAFGLTLDSSAHVYAQGVDGSSNGQVYKYNSDGSAGTPANFGAYFAGDMEFGSDGLLYTADPFNQTILRYTASGVLDPDFHIDVNGLSGFTFLANGDIMAGGYRNDGSFDTVLYKVTFNEEGAAVVTEFSAIPDGYVLRGMTVDAQGNVYTATETCGCDGPENVVYVTGTDGTSTIFTAGDQYQRFNDVALVPEPSTWALVTAGLGVFFVVRRRQRTA